MIVSDTGLPTPESSPEKEKKKGVLSRVFSKSKHSHRHEQMDTAEHDSGDGGGETWHHHSSYFPEYEPIHPSPGTIPGFPGVKAHDRYFPTYTPLLSHGATAQDGSSHAFGYALGPAEAQAAAHSARMGHAVVVHYPDLPRFTDYMETSTINAGAGSGGKGKGGGGGGGGGSAGGAPHWTTSKWGLDGWNGYGWDGEVLPDNDGNTFGAPMQKGKELPKQDGGGGGGGKKTKNKNKKSGGGGGGGGGDDEGKEDDGGDEGE